MTSVVHWRGSAGATFPSQKHTWYSPSHLSVAQNITINSPLHTLVICISFLLLPTTHMQISPSMKSCVMRTSVVCWRAVLVPHSHHEIMHGTVTLWNMSIDIIPILLPCPTTVSLPNECHSPHHIWDQCRAYIEHTMMYPYHTNIMGTRSRVWMMVLKINNKRNHPHISRRDAGMPSFLRHFLLLTFSITALDGGTRIIQ